MPAEPEPPELARLLDYAERARVGDWSLRSALVRYAQPCPRQVSEVLELVRRIEHGLGPHHRRLSTEGPRLWQCLQGTVAAHDEGDEMVLELLRAMGTLDGLAEELVAWAHDRSVPRPDDAVDAAVTAVRRRLDAAGVPHEERVRPPARRG